MTDWPSTAEQDGLQPASVLMPRTDQDFCAGTRRLAEETPVALVFDGTTLAVVMATPTDLTDLAVGFSLTEGIIQSMADIGGVDIVPQAEGVELRIWLEPDSGRRFAQRRRHLVGPTGCGLCGIESLAEANRPLPRVAGPRPLRSHHISDAVRALSDHQVLNAATRATHAAGFYCPETGIMIAREDVGRHNALDKLAGALTVSQANIGTGALVMTSRVSIELVQKAASIGAAVMIAVSAPTGAAVRAADQCGMTLVGIARGSDYEIFTHAGALEGAPAAVSSTADLHA